TTSRARRSPSMSCPRERFRIKRSAALKGCPAAVGRPKGLRYERPPSILKRRSAMAGFVAVAIIASTFVLRAELPEWARNVETAGRWHDAIFRTVPTPAGPVEVRRSPADAHEALRTAPGAAADRELLALRARVAEEKLDPEAAEADWRAYASASTDVAAGQLALADFY